MIARSRRFASDGPPKPRRGPKTARRPMKGPTSALRRPQERPGTPRERPQDGPKRQFLSLR
eukprot:8054297-Pyramimonas_sp.AAC.1